MKKAIIWAVVALTLIGLFVLLIKIVAGAFALVGSFLNTLLGIAVVIALIVIVIWMFSYAKKHR